MTEQNYCKHCSGEGLIHTGIVEASTSLCEACNGTGYATNQSGISSDSPQAKCQKDVVGGAAQGEQEEIAKLRKLAADASEKALLYAAKYESVIQAITDPENQPSQYGTVLLSCSPVLQGEREAFEAWYGEHYTRHLPLHNGEYANLDTLLAWETWKEAKRQARASSAAQIQEQQPNLSHLAEPSTTATDTRLRRALCRTNLPWSEYVAGALAVEQEYVAMLRRANTQLGQWAEKYGEHEPEWLPPAGDVRLAEDITEAIGGKS